MISDYYCFEWHSCWTNSIFRPYACQKDELRYCKYQMKGNAFAKARSEHDYRSKSVPRLDGGGGGGFLIACVGAMGVCKDNA